jgi:hypothetical protein
LKSQIERNFRMKIVRNYSIMKKEKIESATTTTSLDQSFELS